MGIQRENVVLNISHDPATLRNELRLKGAIPIPGDIYGYFAQLTLDFLGTFSVTAVGEFNAFGGMLFITQVIVHFSLEHLLDGLPKHRCHNFR